MLANVNIQTRQVICERRLGLCGGSGRRIQRADWLKAKKLFACLSLSERYEQQARC